MLTFLAGVVLGAFGAVAALYALSRRRPPGLDARHGDDAMPPRPDAPTPIDPQRGHIRRALLGVVLLVAAAGFALRCRPATDAGYAVAGLPAASQCSARSYRCAEGIPEVCASAGGALRWWPTVPPAPDGRRVPCARCVVDADGGVAHCDRADAADGGAP